MQSNCEPGRPSICAYCDPSNRNVQVTGLERFDPGAKDIDPGSWPGRPSAPSCESWTLFCLPSRYLPSLLFSGLGTRKQMPRPGQMADSDTATGSRSRWQQMALQSVFTLHPLGPRGLSKGVDGRGGFALSPSRNMPRDGGPGGAQLFLPPSRREGRIGSSHWSHSGRQLCPD